MVLKRYISRLWALIFAADARHLWKRYALGLGLIVTLLGVSHIAAQEASFRASADAEIINLSGRQRMLSQRILYLSHMAADAPSESGRAELDAALTLFEKTHKSLSGAQDLSERVRAAYFDASDGPSLDRLVERYVEAGRQILGDPLSSANALALIDEIGPYVLLSRLNGVVADYEAEARSHYNGIIRINTYSLYAALIMIILEALLIFLPAQFTARHSLDVLSRQAERLKSLREQDLLKAQQLEALRQTAEHEALHDELTGLPNRRYIERELMRRLEDVATLDQDVGILHVDLDRFKHINDTLGHVAGDHVLLEVTERLLSMANEGEFVSRISGDEFVLLIPLGDDTAPLAEKAEQLIRGLSEPVDYQGELCRFGVSIGGEIVSAFAGKRLVDAGRALENADIALYMAKANGRSRYQQFDTGLRLQIERERRLADDMFLALKRREFFAVYQPQIDAQTGQLAGVEALARWQHPTEGTLMPGEFLPMADRLGLTAQIDQFIMRQALTDLKIWDLLGVHVPRLSVNISARRLMDPRLLSSVAALDIPRGRLAFEILETAFVDSLDDTIRQTLEALKGMGIELDIDDFGTGHASIAAVLAVAPDRIKIPREFIAPLPESDLYFGLVSSIVAIAHSLDLELVAEGVETADQVETLSSIGCQVMQGYLFSKPLTGAQMSAYLEGGPDTDSAFSAA